MITEAATPLLEQHIVKPISYLEILPPEVRLRVTGCGLVSEVLRRQLADKGYDSRLQIRDWSAFGSEGQHVITKVQTSEGPYFIDGTYSQFFGLFGMHFGPARDVGETAYYPDEKMLIYQPADVPVLSEWYADVVTSFWKNAGMRPEFYQTRFGAMVDSQSFPYGLPRHELRDYAAYMWNPAAYQDYEAAPHVQQDAARIYDTERLSDSV